MGDDARKLGFVIRRLNGPHIHENRSTGKRESIDLLLIHHVEAIGPLLPRSVLGQPQPQTRNVLAHRTRIRQYGKLLRYRGSGLLAKLDLILRREQIEAMRGYDARG